MNELITYGPPILALIIGMVIGYIVNKKQNDDIIAQLHEAMNQAQAQISEAENAAINIQSHLEQSQANEVSLQTELESNRVSQTDLTSQLANAESQVVDLRNEVEALQKQLKSATEGKDNEAVKDKPQPKKQKTAVKKAPEKKGAPSQFTTRISLKATPKKKAPADPGGVAKPMKPPTP